MSALNTNDIKSVFKSLAKSDANASLVLDVLLNDKDVSPLEEQEDRIKHSLQMLYLSSIFHDRVMTQNSLSNYGVKPTASDYLDLKDGLESLNPSFPIQNLNDVGYAVFSSAEDSLLHLHKVYESNAEQIGVNEKEAIPLSNASLRDKDAKKHRPLDLALMLYVSQKRSDIRRSERNTSIGKSLTKSLKPVLEKIQEIGGVVSQAAIEIKGGVKPKSSLSTEMTEKKIHQLINLGARGSDSAYFPTADDSLDRPFEDSTGFEVMSFNEFCSQNASLLPPAMVASLSTKDVKLSGFNHS